MDRLEEAYRQGFIDEMEKIALSTEASREEQEENDRSREQRSKSEADIAGRKGALARKHRKKRTMEYLFNPRVKGPVSEVYHRLRRRHRASAAEKPWNTRYIPFYGKIRGGKAGKQYIQKQKEDEEKERLAKK